MTARRVHEGNLRTHVVPRIGSLSLNSAARVRSTESEIPRYGTGPVSPFGSSATRTLASAVAWLCDKMGVFATLANVGWGREFALRVRAAR